MFFHGPFFYNACVSPDNKLFYHLRQLYPPADTPRTTPCQIKKNLDKQHLLAELSMQTGVADLHLLESTFCPDGKFYRARFNFFCESLERLRQSGNEDLIPFLDTKCIYKKGGISLRRLRQIRKVSFKRLDEN